MRGRCTVLGATLRGVEAIPVNVEVSVGAGLPGISIVGLPDSAVQESKLRVRSAIRAMGFNVPNANIVVNLAPSSLKKAGSGFDLPIALGILASTGQIKTEVVAGKTFVGELSLGGMIRSVHGLLAFAMMVRSSGGSLVTGQTADDISMVLPRKHLIARNLGELVEIFDDSINNEGEDCNISESENNKQLGSSRKTQNTSSLKFDEETCIFNNPMQDNCSDGDTVLGCCGNSDIDQLDYSDIAGQDFPKRAMQIAAAGNHSILMIGPPGSGKTMLARRLPTIMPLLDEDERLQAAMIHSVSGLPFKSILEGKRPFRSPHHSATPAGIMGGGVPLTPGEVSLSHNGVLFLDEMPEFSSRVLQMLRQPIEEGVVVLARADGVYKFPARFLLLGAANPCPCGYLGDLEKQCTCAPGAVRQYQSKIGGPLIDRFDMMVNVSRSDPKSVMLTGTGVTSEELYKGVLAAREFAKHRYSNTDIGSSYEEDIENNFACNIEKNDVGAGISNSRTGKDRSLITQCKMNSKVISYMEDVARAHTMSGRGIMKVLKVARTIADIEQSEHVSADHVSEATMFRMQDKG